MAIQQVTVITHRKVGQLELSYACPSCIKAAELRCSASYQSALGCTLWMQELT